MSVRPYKLADGSTRCWYRFIYNGITYNAGGFPNKTQAERAEARRRMQVLDEEYSIELKRRDPPFEELAKKFLCRRVQMKRLPHGLPQNQTTGACLST